MASCEKILIAGFSGAGKTSLLKQLKTYSKAQGVTFSDLDQLILKNHGKKYFDLSELIEDNGWEKFRLWERQEFESWLKEEGKGVIALGGGTLSPLLWELYSKQRKLLFCYLKVPFEVAWQRLVNQSDENRPLVKLGKEKFHELFEAREEIYCKIEWQLDGTQKLEVISEAFWKNISVFNV